MGSRPRGLRELSPASLSLLRHSSSHFRDISGHSAPRITLQTCPSPAEHLSLDTGSSFFSSQGEPTFTPAGQQESRDSHRATAAPMDLQTSLK